MNSFKLFGCKRTLEVFRYVESFFELHSSTTEGKKDKNRAKNTHFLANWKSLNEFDVKKAVETLKSFSRALHFTLFNFLTDYGENLPIDMISDISLERFYFSIDL